MDAPQLKYYWLLNFETYLPGKPRWSIRIVYQFRCTIFLLYKCHVGCHVYKISIENHPAPHMFLGFLVTKNRGKHHAVANTQVFALFRGSAHDPTQESEIRNVCIPWDAPPPNNSGKWMKVMGGGAPGDIPC